jgi:hypothetical protein
MVVSVEEKAEELKPDKNDESVWGEDAPAEKEKEEEKPSERTGRGRGNR